METRRWKITEESTRDIEDTIRGLNTFTWNERRKREREKE